QTYSAFTGDERSYEDVLVEAKHYMLEDAFRGELRDLVELLVCISQRHIDGRDLLRDDLYAALREYIVALPVYRTYVVPERNGVSETDRQVVEDALCLAQTRCEAGADAFVFLRDVLLLKYRGDLEADFV